MSDDTDSEVPKILKSVLYFVCGSIVGGILLMTTFMIFH